MTAGAIAPTDLSRPERCCARDEAKRIRAMVVDAGGCSYCARRSRAFASLGRRAACGASPPMQFPKCVDQAGGFEFDPATMRRSPW